MADDEQRPEEPFLYDAFISYRHVERDRKWAEWLIDALERYRVPKALQDRGLPPRLRKVFRDEDEVPASADLNDQITEALRASRFLIVVCSYATPRSRWVQREIEFFNDIGRGDHVLALLTEGEPADSFPTPMLERHRKAVDPDGTERIIKEDKEPLAADVRRRKGQSNETLKRFALLRLVAVILGVKFDDLRQREHEREHSRVVRWAAAAAALLMLTFGAGFAHWDRMQPKTGHYRQLITRWGLPEGLAPIDEETRAHLEASFSVTTQRSSVFRPGRVVEARRENSAGSLVQDEDGAARWVVAYRESGSAERIEIFDGTNRLVKDNLLGEIAARKLRVKFERNEATVAQAATQKLVAAPAAFLEALIEGKSEVTQNELTFDDNGFTVERRYQDHWGRARHDAQNSFGERYANAPNGLVVRRAEIGPDGSEVTLKNGVQAVVSSYDERGTRVRYALVGADDKLIDGPSGFAYVIAQVDSWGNKPVRTWYSADGRKTLQRTGYPEERYAYDDRGNLIEIAYVGPDGRPTLSKEGLATRKYLRDARGYIAEESYFGIDGESTLINTGYAKFAAVYDPAGHRIQESYFGLDGKPAISKAGYARLRRAFDTRGNLTEIAYYGIDGSPARDSSGIARVTYAYDAGDNETERAFFDVDGKPTLGKSLFARRRTIYDGRGNSVETDYLGVDGRLTVNSEGTAKSTRVYDERGYLAEEAYFGPNGEPTLAKQGAAMVTQRYDERGNLVEFAVFGVDGKPMLTVDGIAGFRQAFDDRGNIVELAYFGVDGGPKLNFEGIAKQRRAYDARGRETRRAFFGTDGQPIVISGSVPYGYAGFSQAFDVRGNKIERAHFGLDGRPTETSEGLARIIYAYDLRGYEVERAFFGIDGRPTLGTLGFAKKTMDYDPRGRQTAETYLGIDGMPRLQKGGYAKTTWAHDARGNRTEIAYFGVDGKPTLTDQGHARVTYRYDDLDRVTATTYFDAQDREISAMHFEVVVLRVFPDSVAERIGLLPGDHLLTYNGRTLTAVQQLVDLVTNASGPSIRVLTVGRGSAVLTFEVASGRLGAEVGAVPITGTPVAATREKEPHPSE